MEGMGLPDALWIAQTRRLHQSIPEVVNTTEMLSAACLAQAVNGKAFCK
jgi:hypothetical protein